jgi:hypothetical protein
MNELKKYLNKNIVKITVEQIFEDNEGETKFNYYLDNTNDLLEILYRAWYKGQRIEKNDQYADTAEEYCDNMTPETFTKIKQEIQKQIEDEIEYSICLQEQNQAYYSDRI